MVFTKEEFAIMVDELLNREPVVFDMLNQIAEKTLRSTVDYWCQSDLFLQYPADADDIMQEIHMRLIKTTVNYFLLREGANGPINLDPAGFSSWMFTVAENIKRDHAARIRREIFRTTDVDDIEDVEWIDEAAEERERIVTLRAAIGSVLDADAGVYKTLTWLAQVVYMIGYDVSKIRSTEMIVETFENKTLGEMYCMIKAAAADIPWLVLSEAQDAQIEMALDEKWDESRAYGQVKFGEFFMKKGGKGSISDWVHRMNTTVRRSIGDAASEY